MQVMNFHLMPYQGLPDSVVDGAKSYWVTLPNSEYDPAKGHALYNRYLDELELCDELGFDGVMVNEHHQTPYCLMPSPVVTASCLARRTKRAKIAIMGSAFCLREHPLTLAEEHAMIDTITGGRLISGFVRGIGAEYTNFGVNPARSHERYAEAHDLVVQAWTRPGPFAFEGKHYHYEYVNVWPRPFQQPHPPIWVPSQGSSETIEFAAHPDRKYVYMQNFNPWSAAVRYLNEYRTVARERYGYDASSRQLAWAAPVYVAATDQQAMDEARGPIEFLFNKALRMPPGMFFPPGYTSIDSMKRVMSGKSSIMGAARTAENLDAQGVCIFGSPDTVLRRIRDAHRELGFGSFTALLQFGTLSAELTERNIRLFAREILPGLHELDDRHYAGFAREAAAAGD
jgi:alkanesulfonate monooxygenase SsuD/methylene tetrahydromethanopterin reductase-like flavin-dependent oxidoreductase (luciferase family)